MPRIVKQPRAVADLDAIYDYIAVENHNPSAADRFLDALLQRMESHARQPLMGDLRDDLGPGLRSFPF
jgi:plasmid stabilization system protein ParE